MIITKIIGGLGNQMFQYALGKHLALLNQTELKLDISGFETYIHPHKYCLNNLNIKENIATIEEINYFKKYQKRSGGWWFLYNHLIANELKYAKEKQFNFNQNILKSKKSLSLYIDGYWQSEKYFKDAEQIIRKDFTVKNNLSEKNLETAQKILNTKSISIHIRRGDYISNPTMNSHYRTCGDEYYKKAIEIILDKIKEPHLFIFSDDPLWVKKNMTFKYPTTYVDHNKSDKNYEDLRIMSLCKHNIIANSSFSWWGAWLNNNPNKIVIAPKKWFNDNSKDTSDLLPDNWIKI